VLDSQNVKTTESGRPRGYDAGKKIKGRKRHILTDTEGNLVYAVIHNADIQDRDGAPLVLAEIVKRCPWMRHIFADGGYARKNSRLRFAASASGPSRSSNGQTPPRASRSCPAAGWLSARWHGLTGTDASPRTSSTPSPRQPHGCSSFQSNSSPAASQNHEITPDDFESDS
jgi:putative transposase